VDPLAEIAVLSVALVLGAERPQGFVLRYICWAGPDRWIARRLKRAQPRVAGLLCPKMKKAAARLPQSDIAELPIDILPFLGICAKSSCFAEGVWAE
jgi:hypothetical protein